jgi:hypothetical protein
MADVLVKFTEPVRGSDGRAYEAQACGSVADDGLWQGWIEFTAEGESESVRTGRETEQPNFADLKYWAQGLTMVFLEGALGRALGEPVIQPQTTVAAHPKFDGPAGHPSPPRIISARPILNPFLVYAEGPDLLRGQLNALSRDQLTNIVKWYNLPVAVDLATSSPAAIADDIARSIHDARRPARATNTERRVG